MLVFPFNINNSYNNHIIGKTFLSIDSIGTVSDNIDNIDGAEIATAFEATEVEEAEETMLLALFSLAILLRLRLRLSCNVFVVVFLSLIFESSPASINILKVGKPDKLFVKRDFEMVSGWTEVTERPFFSLSTTLFWSPPTRLSKTFQRRRWWQKILKFA